MNQTPTPARTRVTRPDTSVDAEDAVTETETTPDAPPEAPEEPEVVERSAEPKVNFRAPFTVDVVSVIDKDGRVACHVGQSHLDIDERTNIANWIAYKLNA